MSQPQDHAGWAVLHHERVARVHGPRGALRGSRGDLRVRRAALVFAAIVAGGVGLLVGALPADGQVVRDSAGLRIVENARPAGGGDGRVATVDPVATVEIGTVEGEAPYQFTQMVHAFEASNGWIVVVEGGTLAEIRVFDRDGVHVTTFGGRGEGPGEFGFDPVIRLLPSDTILAWDPRLRRATWFTLDGTVVRTTRSEAQGLPLLLAPHMWALLPDGHIAVLDLPTGTPDRDGLVLQYAELVLSSLGDPRVRRVPDLPAWTTVSAGGTWLQTFLYPQASWALRTSEPQVVVSGSESGDWELVLYGLAGNRNGVVRADVPRRVLTQAIADGERRWMLERVQRNRSLHPQARAAMENAIRGIALPDSVPAIGRILADSRDRVWVKRWAAPWEVEGTDVYDLIDRSGTWLGWVAVPRSHGDVLSVGEDHILFAWRDALGIPRLRRHTLRLDR